MKSVFYKRILPVGYQRLDYIQSSGTQYINVGLTTSDYTSYEIGGTITTPVIENNNVFLFKGLSGNSTKAKFSNGTTLVRNFIPAKRLSDNAIGMYDLAKEIVEGYTFDNSGNPIENADYSYDKNFIDLTGITHINFRSANPNYEQSKMVFYDSNNAFISYVLINNRGTPLTIPSNAVKARVSMSNTYRNTFYIIDTDNSNRVIYRYSPFYTNAGSGTFSYGQAVSNFEKVETKSFVQYKTNPEYRNLPSGYTQVKYLQSSGGQYINTGVSPTQNTSVEMPCKIISGVTNATLFGSRDGGSPYFDVNFVFATYRINLSYGTSTPFIQNASQCFNTDILFKLKASDGVYIDNTKIISSSGNTFSISSPIHLFALDNNNVASRFLTAQIGETKITEGTTLVRDLVPCYNSNNVAGMYDIADQRQNLFTRQNQTNSAYIDTTGNVITGDSRFFATDFIEVKPNTTYMYMTDSTVNSNAKHCWYDENKQFISYMASGKFASPQTSPSNAKYIRFSNRIAGTYFLFYEGTTTPFYTNSGTGTFIVGEPVSPLVRVEEKGWKLYEYNKVGGKIFYIDETSSGGEYVFYDQNGNVMTDIQVGDTPYKYKVIGTPNKPKFYVFNDTTSTGCWSYKDSNDQWVYNLLGTTDGIGAGKTNTALVMTADNGAYANYNGSVWNALKTLNTNKLGGCNDWFVGSKTEIEALRTSALTTLFSNNNIWCSFELNFLGVYDWGYADQQWRHNAKHDYYTFIPFRSF